MKRNAFQVLQAAGAEHGKQPDRKRKTATKPPTQQGIAYSTCPVCGSTIQKAFLNLHLESCLSTASHNSNQRHDVASKENGCGSSPVLGCGAAELDNEHQQQPGAHLRDSSQRTVGTTEDLGGASLRATAGQQTVQIMPPTQTEGNAFHLMLQNQQACSQSWYFFLELTADCKWTCHWWRKGHVPAALRGLEVAWSAQTSMAGAAGSKQSNAVVLQTNVPAGSGGPVSWLAGDLASNSCGAEGRWRGGISVMKSALQKNVRLCRADAATRCALYLLKEDPSELLRRATIICLEDALLHPQLPLLMWLTAAQAKGYQLGRVHADACLRIMHELASVPFRDGPPPAMPPPATMPPTLAAAGEHLHEKEALLVRSMLMRAAYGGMACDVAMLRGYASHWEARFSGKADPPPMWTPASTFAAASRPTMQEAGHTQPQHGALAQRGEAVQQPMPAPDAAPQPCQDQPSQQHPSQAAASAALPTSAWHRFMIAAYESLPDPGQRAQVLYVGPLRRDDIPLSAVDFHVSEAVPGLLTHAHVRAAAAEAAQKHPRGGGQDTESCLRSAMWLFRSSLNSKQWVLRPGSGRSAEALQLAEQLAHEEADKRRLQALWAVAGPAADAFSAAFIARRFFS